MIVILTGCFYPYLIIIKLLTTCITWYFLWFPDNTSYFC